MSWGTRSRGEAEQAEAVACRGNRAAALESREAAGAGRSEESRMAARRSGMESLEWRTVVESVDSERFVPFCSESQAGHEFSRGNGLRISDSIPCPAKQVGL
jgi:hypothetical protein